jgi:hypothetical protein
MRLAEQVFGWIAEKRELGKHHEVGTGPGSLLGGTETERQVAVDVTDSRVDLCERDSHARP